MILNQQETALAKQGITNRWQAKQCRNQEYIISICCTNKVQPFIPQRNDIVTILDVDLHSHTYSTEYSR